MQYEITIPAYTLQSFNKLMSKASKNIEGLSWNSGELYKRVYRHASDEGIIKMTHTVVDVTYNIPEENNWRLLATVVDGALFVSDLRHELNLTNGHGANYGICDACKHRQWKKSYIVKNIVTGEELQIGAECAKKFGIGMMNAIYKLTKSLTASFILPVYDGDEMGMWPGHFSDPHAVESIETSKLVKACKKYYDDNNGIWKKGYYVGNYYTPSESVADIRSTVNDFSADSDDVYYKSLCEYLNNIYEADKYNEFAQSIKATGSNFYSSKGEIAPVYFAIKSFENWKKMEEAKKNGQYIPHRNDYIYINGKIINKAKKSGYFGDYYEYEILNYIDNNVYKRAGSVKPDDEGNIKGYAYIKDIYKDNFILDRITKNIKKGVKLNNEWLIAE